MNSNNNKASILIDFKTYFPYKFCISDWSKDETYPNGFRYKILSVQNAEQDLFEFVLILEEPNQYKTEMERLKISKKKAIDRTMKIFTNGLKEEHGITFEMLNLSNIKNEYDFDKKVKECGWYEWN